MTLDNAIEKTPANRLLVYMSPNVPSTFLYETRTLDDKSTRTIFFLRTQQY